MLMVLLSSAITNMVPSKKVLYLQQNHHTESGNKVKRMGEAGSEIVYA